MRAQPLAFALLLLPLLAGAQQVEIEQWFPEHPTTEFYPGKPVPLVVGVRNPGTKDLNVTAIAASLNNPFNASMTLYNFTAQSYFQPLAPGDEGSLEYTMWMPNNLPAREFNLKVALYFAMGEDMLASLFFNETINIIEESKLVDTELIGLWLVLIIILGLAVWFATEYLKGLAFVKKASKKSKKGAAKEAAPVDKDEWLKGTYYDQQKKKAVAAAAKVEKKSE